MKYLACYKGPSEGLFNILFHKVVCLVTNSKYSHCEIVIDGYGYSSSARDGGVRVKLIDFNSGKWDLIELPYLDEDKVLKFYDKTKHLKYDYLGVAWFILPFVRHSKDRYFCSEWCAKAVGLPFSNKVHIQDLVETI